MRDLDPQRLHLVKEVSSVSRSCRRRAGGKLPGFFAERTVGFFQERGHLGQGALLAAEGDGHGADRLLVLLLELGELGFAGNVGLTKQGAAVFERAVEDGIAGLGQVRSFRCVEVAVADLRSGGA